MQKTSDFDELIRFSYEKGYFSGAWLYKRNGKIVSRGAVGVLDPATQEPVRTDSLFEIASITKQFTASAIMLLRDKGLLKLDDPLEKYIPKIADPGICVRNRLNHTSGLPDYVDWIKKKVAKDGGFPKNADLEQMLTCGQLPRQFAPNEHWAYCNTGFCVLALIVEKASGMPFADFLRQHLFLPSGMVRTSVFHPYKDKYIPENFARGCILENGRYVLVEQSEKEGYTVFLEGIEGDGSVKTSVDELLLWDEALRRETVLPLSTQQEMFSVTTYGGGAQYPYGYGWQVYRNDKIGTWVSHTGRWAGYNGIFARALEQDSMVALLCNQYGCDILARMQLLDGVESMLAEGQAQLPRTLDETYPSLVPGDVRQSRCGDYCSDGLPIQGLFGSRISITDEDGALKVRLTFMDEQYDSQILSTGDDGYIARDGLFELKIKNGALTTSMYGIDFVYHKA